METTRVALIATMILTAVLAGCMSDDTSDLDARISELEQSNMGLNENLITAQGENAQLQSALDQSVQDYSDLQASLEDAEMNAMELQVQLDPLLILIILLAMQWL